MRKHNHVDMDISNKDFVCQLSKKYTAIRIRTWYLPNVSDIEYLQTAPI